MPPPWCGADRLVDPLRPIWQDRRRLADLVAFNQGGVIAMSGTVGFSGLGAMGGPMAANLVKHGSSLVGSAVDPVKPEQWRARGVSMVESPERVAAAVDRTFCMVGTTAQAEAVIAGERGIAKSARRGHIVVCM